MIPTPIDIIKQKRDKFTVSLRKQRIENLFQVKRAQYLSKKMDKSLQSILTDNNDLDNLVRDILDENNSILVRYNSMINFQLALQKIGKNDQSLQISQTMMQMTSMILLLLNLEDKYKQIDSYTLNVVCLGILINITYFMDAEQIDILINLQEFERIFIFLSCQYTNLQNDCLRFLLNVISGLNNEQSNALLQNFQILAYINNTYNTWGVDKHFINKALKLICFCLNKYQGVYNQNILQESIYTVICIIENHQVKLQTLYYSVVCLQKLEKKFHNKDVLISTNLPAILNDLIKSQKIEDTSQLKDTIIILSLQILISLCYDSDLWILTMLKEGILTTLISTNTNFLKFREKQFQLLSVIFSPDFQIEIEDTTLRLDNQHELIEYILNSIKKMIESQEQLPKYTIQLLSSISLFDVYIDYIQMKIEYFQVVLSEINIINFEKYQSEDIINILISFENMFKYGQKIDNFQRFKEQFISQNGIHLLSKIMDQFNDDKEIIEITSNLIDILE